MKNNPFYEQSDSIKDLIAAIQNFKTDVGKIIKSDINPHFKSKYAGLSTIFDTIDEPLRKHGLLIMQKLTGINTITTTITHVHSCEYISNSVEMILSKNDAQGFGSACTYYKRYSLISLLSINIDDDDDGNGSIATIKDAIKEIKASASREDFDKSMKKYYAFLKESSVIDACKEIALKFPKQ